MIIFVEDLLREINILNWYRGEAVKNGDASAVFVQSGKDTQDVMMFYIRGAVNDVLLLANANRVVFRCEYKDDALNFTIEPVRAGREYMKQLLKDAVRQYMVCLVRFLWMKEVRPEWADDSMLPMWRQRVMDAMSAVTAAGNRVRRRAATMGI